MSLLFVQIICNKISISEMRLVKQYMILIICLLAVSVPESISDSTNDSVAIYSFSTGFQKLNSAMRKLSRKDWPLPGLAEVVKLNDSSEAVLKIKAYLKSTGDLRNVKRSYLNSPIFDKKLEEAVMKFQTRHGLETDGIAGKKTMEEMNVPLSERLNQIKANIERMKNLPQDPGDRYIIVNIPGFEMEYSEEGITRLKMNVVVGEIENYTPVLHDTMTYIVFNPTWNVPLSIAIKEIVPEVKNDPEYLAEHNYVLLNGGYDSSDTISQEDVDWDEMTEENFPISIVQLPGETNSLGRIKFMFPNNLAIYLHDTPSNQLFKHEKRAFSHGCVRLEKPFELAELLLEDQMEFEEMQEILKNEETVSVPLKHKVVVHITYQTAWIDEEGLLHFRDDVYDLDKQTLSETRSN